ncbi:MAG: hypothetical protein AAGF58_00620 [Pseudomonadota bacterium]
MADQYIARRVEQVLRKANGDVAVAERLLQRLCEFDRELMRRLVTPYLPGIVARTLDTDGSKKDQPKRPKRRASNGKPPRSRRTAQRQAANLSAQALDAVVGQMAQQIGETKSPRGMTALVRPSEKPKASDRHLKAVQHLIDSYQRP